MRTRKEDGKLHLKFREDFPDIDDGGDGGFILMVVFFVFIYLIFVGKVIVTIDMKTGDVHHTKKKFLRRRRTIDCARGQIEKLELRRKKNRATLKACLAKGKPFTLLPPMKEEKILDMVREISQALGMEPVSTEVKKL